MTNKLTSLLITTIVISMITVVPAFATHTYTGHKWTKNIYWCIDPKFSSTLKGAITQAATDLNNQPSSFIIRFKTWGDPNNVCINHVHYCTLDPRYLAFYTIQYYSNGNIKQADICVTTHPNNKLDNSACQDFPPGQTNLVWHYNLRYIMHHEFTHTTEQRHAGTAEVSMMNPYYRCAYWGNWSTHDKNTLTFIYPDRTTTMATLSTEQLQNLEAQGVGGHSHEQQVPQVPYAYAYGDKIIHSGALHENNGHAIKKDKHEQQHEQKLSDSQQKTFDKIMKQREQLHNNNNRTGE